MWLFGLPLGLDDMELGHFFEDGMGDGLPHLMVIGRIGIPKKAQKVFFECVFPPLSYS